MNSDAAVTEAKQRPHPRPHLMQHEFKPGQSGNPKGRPRGARSKLSELFIEELYRDFQIHGVDAIKEVREVRPHDYLKVVASLLPKELNVRADVLSEMSDDELVAILDNIRCLVAAGSFTTIGDGATEAARYQSTQALPALRATEGLS
jgi:hypothetical protein